LERGVILGTAGHIDHGKTALVKALTGVDTDRLPEEKRRGITIDLGFAPLILDGIGTIGIIDVPGHEAFVRTMLAGASGIDIGLLVVAADEGVMPQTREHLDILSLLAIPKIVVALTKRDLVAQEWLALAHEDVVALLARTSFAASEIVAVSAITGEGLVELRQALARASSTQLRSRSEEDLFRMPVDRAFTVKGTGTVVTGTVWSGSVGRDAVVSVFPPGRESRVRAIQHHGAAAKAASPGERVALALSDIDVAEVGRGSVLTGKLPLWHATTRIEVELRVLKGAVPGPRTRLRFHLGTSDVGARVSRVLEPAQLAETSVDAGSTNEMVRIAVIALDEPLLVRAGDRFVLRLPSPAITIGGGIVRDPFPSAGKRKARAKIGETPRELLARIAANAGDEGLDAAQLPIRLGVSAVQATSLANELNLSAIQSRLYDPRALATLEREMERIVSEHVENSPLEAGVQLQSLRSAHRASSAVIDRVLDRLVERSRIEIDRSLVKPAGWSPKLTGREKALADAVLHEICIRPSEPPAVSELVAQFGEKASGLLRYLERAGELVRVSDERYYSPAAVEAMVGKLRSQLEPGRIYGPAELREVLGVSRKYLIPFLEFCDIAGVTDRKAEGRVLGSSRVRDGL
jgi:selenocysteine-specific elongation factor